MKTQLKKSLSLFLAVLMVLSCWVWIAPDEAEAANTPEEGYYYVEVRGLLDDWDNDENVLRNNWKITTANGTYTLTSNSIYNGGNTDTTGNYVHAEGWVYGFPTGITHEFGQKSTGSGTNTSYSGDGWGVRDVVVYAGAPGMLAPISDKNGGYKTTKESGSYSGDQITKFKTDAAPKFAYFGTGTGTTIELKLNTFGGDPVSGGSTFTYTNLYDQYGVRWTGATNTSSFDEREIYVSSTSGGSALTGADVDDIYYDSTTGKVVANANLQVSGPIKSGTTKEYYLVQKFKSTLGNGGTMTSTASAKIIVTYPEYTVKVDPKGTVPNISYTLNISDGTTQTKEWSTAGTYSASLGDKPTDASAPGYTFKGFWTEKQPTSTDDKASFYAFEADFAEPISSEKFNEYAADGGKANGRYITYNEKLYYNAGAVWDVKAQTISNAATYYGWWISEDINIKFYDIDGKFLDSMTVKYGQNHSAIDWPTPTLSYVSGAFNYSNFNGTWVDINGDTVSQGGYTFTRDLILTPKYDTVSFDKTYKVSFINEADGGNLTGSDDYNYRTDLSSLNKIPADRPVPSGIARDLQYSYTFEGWSTQKPSSGNYHILLEDGDFNTAGTAIYINSDWIVRSDVTYYPVYRRHLRSYVVEFHFKDSTGADTSRKVTLKYGETLKAPIDYVPFTYAQVGYGYNFENWTYNNEADTFGYDKTLVFTKENITFGLGAENDGVDVDPVDIKASYGAPIPTPYTVTFKYKNEKGEDLKTEIEVEHGKLIKAEYIDDIVTADNYDNGEALVSYSGNWALVNGAGELDGNVVSGPTDENPTIPEIAKTYLTSFSPTSHITFEAIYGNPQPFYTVTYVDGDRTFSERVLVGSDLPTWTIEVGNDNGTPDNHEDDTVDLIEYIPSKADTALGSYTFQGWYDEKQTDENYVVTNGNRYGSQGEATEAGKTTVDGNITLYPQFKFSPFTYEIKFMNHDGTVQLAAGKYEYGQSLEIILAEANRAAQGRAQDDTYTYTFIGWDNTVPAFCEGYNITFTAMYKPVYRYYEAKWYNSVLVDGKWTADKSTGTDDEGKTYEAGLLATTKHTYDSRVFNPAVSAECKEDAPNGQSYVFDGWYYNDAEGNAQPYVRGMNITAAMEFYATYRLTDKLYTVTTIVKGEETTYNVASGNTAANTIADPNAGYVDADKHDAFAGWVTKDAEGKETEFDIANTEITADTTIYAKFTESAHSYAGNEELVTAPTYYKEGEKTVWCSCDAKLTAKTETIDMLSDTVKPTGTIYLGTHGSWSSTDEVGAAATDNNKITLSANANTDIIITVKDTGDVNDLYNPSGIGKGIKNIKVFAFPADTVLTATNFGAAQSLAKTIFEDNSEVLNYVANYTTKLGDMEVADLAGDGSVQYNADGSVKSKNLEDGKAYIIYYTVFDKANNQLNTKVRTAKFIYDTTAPEFTVEGNNNAGKVIGTPTYCGKATVTNIEVGATLTVNGEAATLTTTSAAGIGSYTITEAGNYFVTVTDKAGNKTSKKFTVSDGHAYDVTEVFSTCTTDGYKAEKCIVCDYEKTREIYTSPGHIWSISVVAATCTENGYSYKLCAECGENEKIYNVDGELVAPALGHNYDKVDGEIVYTVVTAPTCKTKGKEIATCKDCGETLTREIAVDENAHNWGASKTLKATCTETGKTYQSCKLCYTTRDIAVIPATGHENTEWVVTTAATCGTAGIETLKCKKCKADVDGDDEDTVADTREIPATGRHILAVSNDPTKTFDSTADMEGQITRYCTQCGQEWVEKVAKIEKYTVKFVDEDGTTVLETITDVVKGTTVEKDAVTEPTKANSADGKYKYTFAGWKDEVGNSVALPIDVTADITLKATYAQSTIIYTHKFVVPNTWVSYLDETKNYTEFATMMGAMGDSRVPVAKPEFSHSNPSDDAYLKSIYTFNFLGWSTTGAKGDIVTDFTITGDTTFYAVFEAIAKEFDVIFYNGLDLVWNTKVDGGETVTFGGTLPAKDSDDDYSYAFGGWYTNPNFTGNAFDLENEEITADTRLYAKFNAIEHKFESKVTQQLTCDVPELTTYTCTVCGHVKEDVVTATRDHKFNAQPETVDGKLGYPCQQPGCNYFKEAEKTEYIVSFYNNGIRIDKAVVEHGKYVVKTDLTDALNAEVLVKAETAEFTYTFAGWELNGDGIADADDKPLTVDAICNNAIEGNCKYVAAYKATKRTYTVAYLDATMKPIKETVVTLEYGAKIPAFVGTIPAKAYDKTSHYEFKGWSQTAGVDTVKGDTLITPDYTAIGHEYKASSTVEATCTTGGSATLKCTCGYEIAGSEQTPALGHTAELNGVTADYKEIKATYEDQGEIYYNCVRCGEKVHVKYTPKIPHQKIVITVYDIDGKTVGQGEAIVTITNEEGYSETQSTDANGRVEFKVDIGHTWTYGIEGDNLPQGSYGGTVGKDGIVDAGKKEEVKDETECSCKCHRASFSGMIFRFFQKILKIFKGEISCCDCPDWRYNR